MGNTTHSLAVKRLSHNTPYNIEQPLTSYDKTLIAVMSSITHILHYNLTLLVIVVALLDTATSDVLWIKLFTLLILHLMFNDYIVQIMKMNNLLDIYSMFVLTKLSDKYFSN